MITLVDQEGNQLLQLSLQRLYYGQSQCVQAVQQGPLQGFADVPLPVGRRWVSLAALFNHLLVKLSQLLVCQILQARGRFSPEDIRGCEYDKTGPDSGLPFMPISIYSPATLALTRSITSFQGSLLFSATKFFSTYDFIPTTRKLS
jgi:hypothetical protein